MFKFINLKTKNCFSHLFNHSFISFQTPGGGLPLHLQKGIVEHAAGSETAPSVHLVHLIATGIPHQANGVSHPITVHQHPEVTPETAVHHIGQVGSIRAG